jgi:tripartite-type tricarboxylate transporter receptor subunit TctC
MPLSRRALLAAPLLAATPAAAAGFAPARPVRMVAPFSVGGAVDRTARLLARGLERRWGQTVTVENRTGAGGNNGAALVAAAAPDGHVLLFATAGLLTVNPHLYTGLPFDLVADLAPVAMLGSIPNVMVVPAASPARDVAGFRQHILSVRRPFTYGSPGSGSYVHLAGALFAQATGLLANHVPFRGSAQALSELASGRLDVMFDNLAGALPRIRDGRLRALAVTSSARSPLLPEVPTLAEAGVPGVEVMPWYALYAPGLTEAALRAQIAADVAALQKSLEGARGAGELGITIEVMGPEALARMVERERARFGGIVRAANITVD